MRYVGLLDLYVWSNFQQDRHPGSTVHTALEIWVGSKLCATEKSLTGVEILGMTIVQEPGQLLDRLIPAPPKIDHQLDSMVIEWMCETASKLMSYLARKLIAKKRRDWFEVYLTIFVLLNNIEYVYGMQKEFMMGWFAIKDVSLLIHCKCWIVANFERTFAGQLVSKSPSYGWRSGSGLRRKCCMDIGLISERSFLSNRVQ
jgi:hypothetical protein